MPFKAVFSVEPHSTHSPSQTMSKKSFGWTVGREGSKRKTFIKDTLCQAPSVSLLNRRFNRLTATKTQPLSHSHS